MKPWEEIYAKYERLQKYEQLEQDARREAELRGRRAGKREGKRQGMREFLLRLLEKRFAVLPDRYVRRVKRASDAQLEVRGERILAARTLEEIFA